MKKLIAAALIAGAAFVAVPTAANAATGYAPQSAGTVSGTLAPGGTAVASFSNGVFTPNETVRVQVTGAGAVTLGALPVTTVSKDYTATSTGALTVRVTFPAGGSGTYNLTATGATSGVPGTGFFTIAPAGAAGTVGSTGGSGTPGQLAFTGGTISTLGLWAAGGAIALGGGLLVVRKSVRRQRDAA
ncbi:sortase [Curtobacterium sp. RHCJP20]|uniref:Sortase n=1 Tax=Curtobacterium subtropicum TaxID=3055138 RepID=A0ABT7TCZ0_9MICO|nr:sortase [Curtobacterium subtropicum]MDM7887431.1 sortase [Curtobacterium subtropicum]